MHLDFNSLDNLVISLYAPVTYENVENYVSSYFLQYRYIDIFITLSYLCPKFLFIFLLWRVGYGIMRFYPQYFAIYQVKFVERYNMLI